MNSAAGRVGRLCAALALACLAAVPALAAAPAAVALRTLPDIVVRSLGTRKDVRLPEALAGRPTLVLLTEGAWPPDCPLRTVAGELQRDYATWFSWVAVMSGPLTADDIERIQRDSPVRLDRLYVDRPGLLRAALGVELLPLLLLVDAEGVVREGCASGGDAGALTEAARSLWNLAGPSRWRHSGFEDFRLPQVGGQKLVSFLDVAGAEGTMVAFLNSRCLACARELEVLDLARQERGGRVSFVAVFIDPAEDSRIRGFLAAAGATPDYVLRDPDLRLGGRYAIRSAPALLVIDTLGGIVLSRTGYRESERELLEAELVRAFDEAAPAARSGSAVAEARRLHEEAGALLRAGKPAEALALQQRILGLLPEYHTVHLRIAEAALADGRLELARESLARYLAAEPMTYDSAAVRRTIEALGTPSP